MLIFLDSIHQGGKYTAQISGHQAEMRREGKFTDQNSLAISSLHIDYLNIDISSDRNNDRSDFVQVKCTFC